MNRPLDANVGIIPGKGALPFGGVMLGGFIDRIRVVGQHEITMRKARRNPQLPMIFLAQFDAHPFSKVGRPPPHVNSYIEHTPRGHPDKFALRMLGLIMESTNYAVYRASLIVLDEADGLSKGGVDTALVPALQEKTSLISKDTWLQHEHTRQAGRPHD